MWRMVKTNRFLLIGLVCILSCGLCSLMGIGFITWSTNKVTDYKFPLGQQWEYQVGESVRAIAVSPQGQIVIQTANSVTSLSADGQKIWEARLPRTPVGGSPVVSGDIVFVSHRLGTNAYDLQTGNLVWQEEENYRGSRTFTGAANEDMVVIVGEFIDIREKSAGELLWRVNQPVPDFGVLTAIDDKYLYVIYVDQIESYDLETGDLLWAVRPPVAWSLRGFLFDDGVLFLETLDNGVGAFNVNLQKLIWSREGDFETFSNPIAKYQHYLFVPTAGHPMALDAQTGDILWEATGTSIDTYSTSLVVDDVVYVKGVGDRNLYALDLQNGNIVGYLDLGLDNMLFIPLRETSVGPFSVDNAIIFADNKRLFMYDK